MNFAEWAASRGVEPTSHEYGAYAEVWEAARATQGTPADPLRLTNEQIDKIAAPFNDAVYCKGDGRVIAFSRKDWREFAREVERAALARGEPVCDLYKSEDGRLHVDKTHFSATTRALPRGQAFPAYLSPPDHDDAGGSERGSGPG